MKGKILLTVIFSLTIFSATANAAWYDAELASAKEKGFVSAELYEDADKYITRGEVCDLLVSYYEYKNPDEDITLKANSFTDISSSKYNSSVEKAYSLGIISGITETEFAPDKNITREQFVSLVYRMNGSPMAHTFYYDDSHKISDYAFPAIDYSVANKIVLGTAKGYFSPKDNITNAQAIVIVNRMADNPDLNKEKSFSFYQTESESDDYLCYITRSYSPSMIRVYASMGKEMENRPLDELVIIDKKTDQRKIIKLEEIVSLHHFDLGGKLYIPICKFTMMNGIQDSYTEGMYVVDKKTGTVTKEATPLFIDAFALANDCIYYQTNVKSETGGIRPTVSKYNLSTKKITVGTEASIGDFDGNFLLYLNENEAVCGSTVNNISNYYSINLDTLDLTLLSVGKICTINDHYYITFADETGRKFNVYDRASGRLLKTQDIDDLFFLIKDNSGYVDPLAQADMLLNTSFYDVNGEIYVRYKKSYNAVCLTNETMFDLDFFYSFLDDRILYYNKLPYTDSSRFFNDSPYRPLSPGASEMYQPTSSAAVASLSSRKVYGTAEHIDGVIEERKMVREFCESYKRNYSDPRDLIDALNNYLTFECVYDYATYNKQPTNRMYSAYSEDGIIFEQSAVCGGYARAVEKVLEYAKIKNLYITGNVSTASEPHAWNMIELDGEKYFFDTTWNSCAFDPYDYYYMSYDDISVDHFADEEYKKYF